MMAKLTKKQSKSYLLPAASTAVTGGLILDQYRRHGNSLRRGFGVLFLVTSGACLLVYSTRKTNLLADVLLYPKWFYGIKK